MKQWSFLTNHARVLVCIANDPGLRLRDMAAVLGITERSAYAIVADLTDAGYVLKERDGRRNRYSIQRHMPLPDSTNHERTVGEVLNLLVGTKSTRRAPTNGARATATATATATRTRTRKAATGQRV